MTEKKIAVELRGEEAARVIVADSWIEYENWIAFFKSPAEGGKKEVIRFAKGDVVAIGACNG